jgi:hypothetical protein
MSAIKIQTILIRKSEKKIEILNFSCDPNKTNQKLPKKLCGVIKVSKFYSLRILDLIQVGDFPPSVKFGVTVDHYFDLKSGFSDSNLIVESNVLSKSGLGIKI